MHREKVVTTLASVLLKLYIAQAVTGAAVGFAIPFLRLFGML